MKLLGLLLLFSSVALAEVKEFELAEGKLIVENGAGNINIQGKEQNKVVIDFNKVSWGKNCEINFEQSGKEVLVQVKQKFSWGSEVGCQVDFNISMPAKITSYLRTGSGDIVLEGLSGNVDFKMGSGNMAILKSAIDSIEGKSGSGNISLIGTFGEIDLKVGSGKVSTVFEKISGKTSFRAKAGSGDISLKVPANSKVKTHFKSGSGQLKNKVSYSDEADLDVLVKTGSGDLKIDQL